MKITATLLLATTFLVGGLTPLAAAHPDHGWSGRATWSPRARRPVQTPYQRGYAAGVRAGWQAGYEAGYHGHKYYAQCAPPKHRHRAYLKGYRAGFAKAYRDGYHQGRRDRRPSCFGFAFRW
jgi:flagellar biosynthesis/type III secretory pathway protein FliH